jgi:hypothetical protein
VRTTFYLPHFCPVSNSFRPGRLAVISYIGCSASSMRSVSNVSPMVYPRLDCSRLQKCLIPGSSLLYPAFPSLCIAFSSPGDFIDDRYFKKANDSDCSQYTLLYPKTKPSRESFQSSCISHTSADVPFAARLIGWDRLHVCP